MSSPSGPGTVRLLNGCCLSSPAAIRSFGILTRTITVNSGGLRRLLASSAGMERQTDEQLMRRVANGDHGAFSVLVDRHMRRVVSLAQSITRIRADADDIAQE